jgi:light-regulated signal transduction histidine kinase (bacteriophytochrome)
VANRFTGDPTHRSFENRVRCKDGSYRWMLWNSTAVPEQELLFAIGRDNTERHRTDERLKATATELTRSNAELDQFAYVASHDLQEPLRGVVGCVQLLHRRYAAQLDTPAGELIQHAIDGVGRMQRLIGDLLAYSRVSKRDLVLEPVDFAQVLRQVRDDLAAAIAENGASITEEALPALRVDPVQMGQLLQNLIGNAIKYRAVSAPSFTWAPARRQENGSSPCGQRNRF